MSTSRRIFTANLLLIVLGGAFLFWYYHIDGVYMNPVITYDKTVDPMELKLTKHTYQAGEMAAYRTKFCKNREAVGVIQWALADGVLTFYPPQEPKELPVDCYPDGPAEEIIVPIEFIPKDAEKTCDHYFSAVIRRDIGGGRVITEAIKTEEFCVS